MPRFSMLLVVALAFLVSPATQAETCSCSAPDGSCSARVDCPNGCAAICADGGTCTSWCSKQAFEPTLEGLTAQAGTADTRSVRPRSAISLEVSSLSETELSAVFTDLTGGSVTFVPSRTGERLSISALDYPLDELLAALSAHGVVLAGARTPGADGPLSLRTEAAPAAAVARAVASATGGRATFTPRQPAGRITLEVRELPVEDLLRQLALFGRVELDGRELRPR